MHIFHVELFDLWIKLLQLKSKRNSNSMILFMLNFKLFQVYQQKKEIMNQAGIIISEKLGINQSLYIELDSIAYSYQKSYIQNIKSVSLGNEQILVPNLCYAIKRLINCSYVILTSQV